MPTVNAIKNYISFSWSLELTRVNSRNIAVAGICLLGTMVAIKLIWDYFKKESASSSLSPTQALSTVVTHPSTPKIDKSKFFFPMSLLSAAPIRDVIVAQAFDNKQRAYNVSFDADIWRRICEFLPNPTDILHLSQTCRALLGLRTDAQVLQIKWQNHITDLEKVVFGKEAWNAHFGDVGEVDPIPEALVKALEEPCPFIAGKKVKETHIACWIPTRVNSNPLTLNTIGELVKKPLKGHTSKYDYILPQVKTDHGDKPTEKGHWILLTKNVLEGSRDKAYNEQKQLVESYSGYEVPTALSTAIALFMHHARTGERLYNDNPWTYTRCQEKSNGFPLLVGGFAASGLHVYYYDYDYECVNVRFGVVGLRKF